MRDGLSELAVKRFIYKAAAGCWPGRRWVLLGTAAPLLAGCFSHPPPPIAAGLPLGIEVGPGSFNERVNLRFPVGTDEKTLRDELTRERFAVSGFVARFETQNFPCKDTWRIRWSAEQGKIASIEGYYGSVCL
jgi:hypothetical protein